MTELDPTIIHIPFVAMARCNRCSAEKTVLFTPLRGFGHVCRILFWQIPPGETCGAAALDVVGQSGFAGSGENRWESVSANTLCWPYGICFHQGKLAIADSGNNRVMLWDCRAIIESMNQV